MIEINLAKLIKSLQSVVRPVVRSGKVYQRRMDVRTSPKEDPKNPHLRDMQIAQWRCEDFTKKLYDKYGFSDADSKLTLSETVKRKQLEADVDKTRKLYEDHKKKMERR